MDIPLETAGGNVPYKGFSYGLPYQLVDAAGVMTPALDKTRPVTVDPDRGPQWPTEDLPLPLPPDVVRREGDPTGGFDKHWMGYDPAARVLYEVIQLNRLWLADEENQFEWTVGYNGIVGPVARWDTSKVWNAQPTSGGGGDRGAPAAAHRPLRRVRRRRASTMPCSVCSPTTH